MLASRRGPRRCPSPDAPRAQLMSRLLRAVPVLLVVILIAGCGSEAHVRVSAEPPVALWDAPLRIAVSGLRAGGRTVLHASSRDATGTKFVSSTTVRADASGRLVLTGPASWKPLWSLRPPGVKEGTDFQYRIPAGGATITLSVDGAQTTIRRLTVAPGVRRVEIRRRFYGNYYEPASATTPRPAVLVFGGSEGRLFTTYIARLYASHGYPTLALAYFGEPGLPKNLVRVPLSYFATALRWLQRQQGVDPAKLAVEGISRGSEAAQLLGIHYPTLVHAVIALVPNDGAECGITRNTFEAGSSRCIGAAWTFHGRVIPWGSGVFNPHPFSDERINGPIFLDCGGYDQVGLSCPMAQAIVSRLRAHHFPHKVVFLDYPQAGHGVGDLYPNVPYYSGTSGQDSTSNNVAAADGWPKLLRFLATLGNR